MPFKTFLLIIVLFPFSFGARGQNWKTVSNKDTIYFEAGVHKVGFPESLDSNVLRAIWVDSSRQLNGDSVYYFYPAIRGVAIDSCLDTVAATWLGKRFIRAVNGTELFFNSNGDTIAIKTAASLNDTWILGKDIQGLVYRGTVSSVDTMTIDNIPDSVKTISIQAYSNNVAVASRYNNLVLQFSKEHGWIKTLDLYCFPNNISGWEDFGVVVDTTQHTRLNKDFNALDLGKADLLWKYAPGNEWIQYQQSGELPYTVQQETLTYDSVISSYLLSPDTAIVQLKTDEYTAVWPISQVTTSTSFHTDTVYNSVSQPLSQFVLPEYNAGNLGLYPQRFFKRYFTDTFCNGLRLVTSHDFDGLPLDHFGCWSVGPGVSGQVINDTTILQGFGIFALNNEIHNIPPFTFSKTFYGYLHLGSCIQGTKVDVIALAIEQVNKRSQCSIYPNPAKDKLFIRKADNETALISLYDITGRLLQQFKSDKTLTELSISDYVPGIYILSVQTGQDAFSYKLMVE